MNSDFFSTELGSQWIRRRYRGRILLIDLSVGLVLLALYGADPGVFSYVGYEPWMIFGVYGLATVINGLAIIMVKRVPISGSQSSHRLTAIHRTTSHSTLILIALVLPALGRGFVHPLWFVSVAAVLEYLAGAQPHPRFQALLPWFPLGSCAIYLATTVLGAGRIVTVLELGFAVLLSVFIASVGGRIAEAQVLRALAEDRGQRFGRFCKHYGLSPREQELCQLLLQGMGPAAIAQKLYIAPGTAKLHSHNIYTKTKTHSRVELLHQFHVFS
jgi:DNA-binding CsgD family transcriptional regulator